MKAHASLALFMLAAALVGGCQRTPRLEQKVAAETSTDFARWQRDARGAFTADEWAEFETALQDIKVKIITHQEATGADAVNDALRPKVNGRTVREVLQQGYDAKRWRLGVEKCELEKMMQANSSLRTTPGDTASSGFLGEKRQKQEERLKKVGEEIRDTEEKLKALAGK